MGLRAAMSDMAETIRRVFQAPPARTVALAFRAPVDRAVPSLAAQALEPPFRFQPATGGQGPLGCGPAQRVPLAWTATLRGEAGLASWATGAQVCAVPVFKAERTSRLEVPALPRRAPVLREPLGSFATGSRPGLEPFQRPATRSASAALAPPRSFRALAQVLALPVAFTSEDLQKIPRPLWMRYTLQLVRSTGENIRNLDFLGLYRIPAKGAQQVHHDPATGRLMVTLGPEAAGAPRAPFILARHKETDAVVCCFVEEAR